MKELYFSNDNIISASISIKELLMQEHGRPRTIDFDLRQAALLVTDMQYYFTDEKSHAFIPSSTAIIPPINALIQFFHSEERPIIFSRHLNSQENAGMMKLWWRDLIDPASPKSEIDHRLDSSNSVVIEKSQYDAFFQTKLEALLNNSGSRQLVICGVMANLCCETTVRTAFVKGFHPFLPIDTTASYNKVLHLSTFRNLSFGFTPLVVSDELINSFSQ